MKVVCVGGWGCHPVDGVGGNWLQGREVAYFDACSLLGDDAPLKEEVERAQCILLGWSMGSFIASRFFSHPNVRRVILVGTGLSFCKNAENPYGVDERVLEKMIKAFDVDGEAVLAQFHRKAGIEKGRLGYLDDGRKRELQRGLAYLKVANLGVDDLEASGAAESIFRKEIIAIHGKRDRILSYKNALLLSSKVSMRACLVGNAGHGRGLEKEVERWLT